MNKLKTALFLLCLPMMLGAKNYYVATDGNDKNSGTKEKPFATLMQAQSVVAPGDTVYIRGGVYKPTEDQLMGVQENIYSCVFLMDKSGNNENERICYFGYPGEHPVFDLSEVKPVGMRISVFYVSGSYLHFKNLEVIHTQVTITTGNTQSECFSNRGGSHNIYENLSMHDGMAIGFYLVKGADNLVLNCDAYKNHDNISNGGAGGNTDGFGGHPDNDGTGNVFRGCRAWWNSDDGFDLIHANQAVTIDHCWAFYNGYQPGTFQGAGDGNGMKAGGYGMNENSKFPEGEIPMHQVTNCIAYRNRSAGFYANHHTGGILWLNNTALDNRWNYNMVCRKSIEEPVDVAGYGHILRNNVSYFKERSEGIHVYQINESLCEISNNSFLPEEIKLSDTDFVSLNEELLTSERQADGSLPDIDFLCPTESSALTGNQMGYTFEAPNYDDDPDGDGLVGETEWLMQPAIRFKDNQATIEGPNADLFTDHFYINNERVTVRDGVVDLSEYSGKLELKATSSEGGVIKLIINK